VYSGEWENWHKMRAGKEGRCYRCMAEIPEGCGAIIWFDDGCEYLCDDCARTLILLHGSTDCITFIKEDFAYETNS